MQISSADNVKVTLDGESVETFISADDEAGWVRISADVVKRGKIEIIRGHDGSSLAKSSGAVSDKPARKSGWLDRR